MTTIQRFEDLHAWQTARELTNFIYELSNAGSLARDFGLRDQIRRASASVMLNIAEGFNAGSDAEFVRFLGYARRSASETQAALYIALDQKYIDQAKFDVVYEKTTVCKKQINALITYLHKPRPHAIKESSPNYELTLPSDSPDPFDHQDNLDH